MSSTFCNFFNDLVFLSPFLVKVFLFLIPASALQSADSQVRQTAKTGLDTIVLIRNIKFIFYIVTANRIAVFTRAIIAMYAWRAYMMRITYFVVRHTA